MIRLDISAGGDVVGFFHYPENAVVYLDHHALMEVAETHSDRFSQALESKASTLAMSWVNFVQLTRVSQRTRQFVCRLLGRVQPSVVFVDTDLTRVRRKEIGYRAGLRRNAPYLHDEWVELVYRLGNRQSLNPLDLPEFLERFGNSELAASLQETETNAKREFGELFEDARRRMKENPEIARRAKAPPRSDLDSGTAIILFESVKYLTKTNVNVREGDNMNDAWHTTVPIWYCDFVVLDKHWAEIVRQIQAAVRKALRIDQQAQVSWKVDDLLPALEAWQPSR